MGKTRETIWDVDALFEGIRSGDRPALSRGITLVESRLPDHRPLADRLIGLCLPYSGQARRIGISGAPGAGKSTFIESAGMLLVAAGHKLAVLAIDPSSPVSRGSILGDKTRMERLSRETSVFIRPTAAGESLGGVARATRETMILCEAAGFDHILIETVGVGQSETTVRQLVDCFVLVLIPGAGDDLQGIKKGIVEMADIIVVNKADGDNLRRAGEAAGYYRSALHLLRARSESWQVPVLTCSSLEEDSVTGILTAWADFFGSQASHLLQRRRDQAVYWLHHSVNEKLTNFLKNQPGSAEAMQRYEQLVAAGKLSAFEAADAVFNLFLKNISAQA